MIDPRALAVPERVRRQGNDIEIDGVAAPKGAEVPLVERVSNAIYAHIYAQLPDTQPVAGSDSEEWPLDALMAAVDTSERWDAGWKLDSIGPDGEVSVTKDASWRYVQPGEFRRDPAGRGMRPDTRIAILVRPTDLESQPGSIFIHGTEFDDRVSNSWLGRVYFNASPESAIELVASITPRLNQFRVPFTMKCPTSRSAFSRVDSLVLYFPIRLFDIVSTLVAEQTDYLTALRGFPPMFTKQLHPGVGFAEDPGSPWSFGSHRCRLTAIALIEYWNGREVDDWPTLLERVFKEKRLDVHQPWLEPKSLDQYELPTLLPS